PVSPACSPTNSPSSKQRLTAGHTLSQSFTALSSDETAIQLVPATINCTLSLHDALPIYTGAVTEDVAVSTGNLVTSGALSIADVDPNQPHLDPRPGHAACAVYGTLTLAAARSWNYTASDSQTAVQQPVARQSLTHSFTAA